MRVSRMDSNVSIVAAKGFNARHYYQRALLLMLILLGHPASAVDNAWWDNHGSFQLDGVVSGTFLEVQDKPFDESFSLKDFTGISERSYTIELRPNLELDIDSCNINFKPRYRMTYLSDLEPTRQDNEIFVNTALLDCRLADAINLKLGRQRFTWGNSQFRSPSNPFFAEAVLFNPVNELTGKDFVILDYSPNFNWKFSGIAHLGESHLDEPANAAYRFIKSYGVKAEYTGQSSQWGGIISRREGKPTRLGVFTNHTLSRALLGYSEFSIAKDSIGLLPQFSENDLLANFESAAAVENKYRYSLLLGASYTLMNGWTTGVEYLNSNEGFNNQQADRWSRSGAAAATLFNTEQAAQVATVLASAIDPLWRQLRQNYFIVNVNRSDFRNTFDIAFQAITNLDDNSNSIAASVVYQSSNNTELFLVASANTGGGAREFERLISNAVLIGLRFYTF